MARFLPGQICAGKGGVFGRIGSKYADAHTEPEYFYGKEHHKFFLFSTFKLKRLKSLVSS